MANHNQNGGRNIALPDESRPSWRPQDVQAPGARTAANEDDHDYRSWRERNHRDDDRYAADRDPRRWEGGRGSELGYTDDRDLGRSTERYGQGQSGYASGRYGDDRSQQMQSRNDMVPSPGSFEDRHHDLGVDDRFTGGGRGGYWEDRAGYDPQSGAYGGRVVGRGFESERVGPARGGSQPAGAEWRGGASGWRSYDHGSGADLRPSHRHDQRMGYPGSSGPGGPSMGYQSGSYGRGYSGYGSRQPDVRDDGLRYGAEPHVHRGTGPHRGKGPLGYQRSDERIRELVSEALADDDQIDASQILVSVKDGEVTLSGVVEDRRARRDAEDCVASIAGVRDVQVQLRVKDDRLARAAQATLGTSSGSWETASSQSALGKNETEMAPQDRKPRA